MVYLVNVISALAWMLNSLLELYFYIVIGSAILSWVNPDPYNPLVRFVRGLTQPAYGYIRRYIPFVILGGFDLSPIVLLLVIKFCEFAVVRNLTHLANQMIGM